MFDEPLIHARLLDTLLNAKGPRSRQQLAADLAMDDATLRYELQRLRQAGCELDDRPHEGVRLEQSGLGTWRDYLAWALRGPDGSPRLIEVYRQTSSTQDAAHRLVAARGVEADGALVLADEQLAGRGRLGRRWTAPPGRCVMLSRVLISRGPTVSLPLDLAVLAAAVAVAQGVEAAAPGIASPGLTTVSIKWPNDVLIGRRKLAGILVEAFAPDASTRVLIVGVGINVSLQPAHLPPDDAELPQRITSLAMQGFEVNRLRVIVEVMRRFDALLASPDAPALVAAWRKRSILLGRTITARCDDQRIQGEVVDLEPRQGLIVRDSEGITRYLPAATTSIEAW